MDTEDESEWRGYVLFGQFHLIDLYPENNSLLSRLAKTAEEYGWKIKPPGFITAPQAGYDIEHMAKTGADFSMIIDTSTSGQTPNPRRQAKITSLIFEYLFQIDLSGTKIEESSGGYDSQSTTIE